MERIVAVIPARMGSTRFPGKPLAPLLGRPMIEHVVRRAKRCGALAAVYVATCDEKIREAAEVLGIPVIMTSAAHERASERVAEAAENLEADIVVMIQGDEPMITPGMIDAAIKPLQEDASVNCVNLVHRIQSREDFLDPNTIKVVMNADGDALYFSRAPIPYNRMTANSGTPPRAFKHIGLYVYRRETLLRLASLPPTPLESAELLEQLRALEHGIRIKAVETRYDSIGVDTPEDLAHVRHLLARDVARA